jgi:lipoprotein-anchoring transpeptidase ErfK/SrfK
VFVVALVAASGGLAGFQALAGPARPVRDVLAAPIVPATAGPPPGTSLVATARGRRLAVYWRPGGRAPRWWLGDRTAAGSPRVLLVHGRRAGWVELWLPVRPNGSTGWVRGSAVALAQDSWRLVVRLRQHRLLLLHDGRVVRRIRIAAGARATPTPHGRFFITELLRQPQAGGVYGPWVFGLSGFSRVITRFRGGDGEIGLHGTDAPWLLGREVSHGCVRMANRDVIALARVLPLGTPVDIRAS